MKLEQTTETFPVVDAIPLRLSVVPEAIRQHFENCPRINDMSDDDLLRVGEDVLTSDSFYKAFNEALRDAVVRLYGFDPDD